MGSSRLRAREGQGHAVCSDDGRRAGDGGCVMRAAARWLRRAGCGARELRCARAAAHLPLQPKCASIVQRLRTRGTGSR